MQKGFVGPLLLIAIGIGVLALGGGAYLFVYKHSPNQDSNAIQPSVIEEEQKQGTNADQSISHEILTLAPSGINGFSKVVEISGTGTPPNRGYIIAGSVGGFWAVNNKLAYTLNYIDSSEHALICDGKEVYRATTFDEVMAHKPATAKSCSVSYIDTSRHILYYDGKEVRRSPDFINGVEGIDKTTLAYYTFDPALGQKFFFGDKTYDMPGTFLSATLIKGKLALRTTDGVLYDGSKLSDDEGVRILSEYEPDSTLTNFASQIAAAKSTYGNINREGVVGGKLIFFAQKKVSQKKNVNLYMLVYDGKELGVGYDSVTGYIDSAGRPAYLAANYKRDNNGNIYVSGNAQFLIKDEKVLFSAVPGKEEIHSGSDLVDINGNPAVIIRTPMTDSLYIWYKGKKFFEGYTIHKILNLNGKLAVLVEKDKVQAIFVEK